MRDDFKNERVFARSKKGNTTERCDNHIRSRSEMLRDPFSIVELIGVFDDVDHQAATALTVPNLLTAIRRVSTKEAASPRVDLALTRTWATYMKRIAALSIEGNGDPFAAYRKRLQDPALCRNSRQSLRSALVRYAELVVETLGLQMLERLLPRTSGRVAVTLARALRRLPVVGPDNHADGQLPPELCGEQIILLSSALRFLTEGVRLAPVFNAETQRAPTRQRGTKRPTLTALNRLQDRRRKNDPDFDWRDEFWRLTLLSDRPLQTKLLVAIIIATGCRPVELVHKNGLEVGIDPLTGTITITIHGAKVKRGKKDGSADTGQERREISFAPSTPELQWLAQTIIRRDLAGRLPDFAVYRNRDSASMKLVALPHGSKPGGKHRLEGVVERAFKEMSEAAFPRLGSTVTAYCFRHAFGADLKAAGWGADDIARALGHMSERTQSTYGHGRQGKAAPHRANCVRVIFASNEVRKTRAAHYQRGTAHRREA